MNETHKSKWRLEKKRRTGKTKKKKRRRRKRRREQRTPKRFVRNGKISARGVAGFK